MPINRLNARTSIFSGGAFTPRPEVSPSIEPPPITAEVTDVLKPQLPEEASPLQIPAGPGATESCADIVYLSDLPLRPVEWLWQDRLASGTLAMISGEPGSGKTWVALAIAAALSRGRAPFTGEKLKPRTTLYASMEHDSSEVIHPRFAKQGGDATRFGVLRGAISAPSAFEDALQRTQAGLLILDPFHTLFGHSVDLHQPTETRPLLEKLARLAEKYRCCILLIRHLNKRGPGRPVYRGHGSTDISAALRTEFLAGTSPDAPSQPTLLQVKSNLGPLASPLAYKIDDAGNFLWTGPSKLTPEEVLATRPTGAGLPKRRFAGDWLRQYLQDGGETQGTIEREAYREGVCISTLRRAKFDLGVLSAKDGVNGPWYWTLPPQQEPQPAVKGPR
jgi:AAA domain